MKKKQNRRVKSPGTKDNTSSCSDNEKMKSSSRRSSRKKKMSISNSKDSGLEVSMIDSAYEADDSSRSDASPPKQQAMDEYEIDTIEDVPVVHKSRKRKNGLQNKQIKAKKGKKRNNLNMSTSTPVLDGEKSRGKTDCHLVTPEVTPILAVPHNIRSAHNEDNSTPTLRKSLRKRSFSFHDPDLSTISPHLSFDSHGDSGIVSPALKKIKSSKPVTPSGVHHLKLSKVSKEKNSKVSAKQPPTSPVSAKKRRNMHENITPRRLENYSSVKSKPILRETSMNNSCFGFDSIQTPSPVFQRKRSRKIAKKITKESTKSYRSPKNSSDSIFDESPGAKNDSSSLNSDSQENICVSKGSPSLFSDDIFSYNGDLPSVNKSSNKSYKGFKPKLKKSKPQVSKLDAWASSFNTELENIEKFDLNIE